VLECEAKQGDAKQGDMANAFAARL